MATQILVVGSLHKKEYNNDLKLYNDRKPRFDAACRALGGALAKSEHVIMAGVPEWPMLGDNDTVGNFVVEGADQAHSEDGKKSKVIFYGPKEIAPPDTTRGVVDTLQELKDLPHVDVEESFLGRGAYKAKLITNVTDADGVIIIGGGDGTASVGYAGYSMHKPTIALPSLGGAAQQVYNDVLLDEYTRLISPNDIRALEVYWDPDPKKNEGKASEVVRIIDKLIIAYDQASKTTRNALTRTLGWQVVLLLAWLAIYLLAPRCPAEQAGCGLAVNVAFFSLLYISALLGAGLRTLVAYQEGKLTRLTWPGFLLDLVISLIVAFGLSLFYLIGGISFTGKVVVFDPTSSSSQAFATIAISMSLIGLAAGYLVPLNQLRERLEKAISQEPK